MKKTIALIFTLIFILLSMSSCADTIEKSDEPSIVCTTFPQYDFVKNIIGSDEGITLLLDNGADLHSYEPTAQDIIKIGNADLFIYGGGTSDKWVEGALKSANNPNLKTVAIMDLVNALKEEYVAGMQQENHGHEHHSAHNGNHDKEDEHIWLSLKNAAKITQALCEFICEIDPQGSASYRANARNYISRLNELDGEYSAVIEASERKVLLFADRFPFRYLTDDYGLTYYAAFAGCSSESEATFETMAFLIEKTKELKLPTVLIIDDSDGSLAKTVCDATGAEIASLDSCQSVSSVDISNGANYIDIMKKNLEVIEEALN